MSSRLSPEPSQGKRPRYTVRRALRVVLTGLIGAGVVTGGSLGWHHFEEAPEWEVHEVQITGNTRASTPAIMHLANIRKSDHLLDIDLEATQSEIERHPWVKSATIHRDYPSTIRVEVEEYEPVLLLALERLYYVDEEGTPFRSAKSNQLDYPVLTGIRPDLAQNQPDHARAVIAGALRLYRAIETHPQIGPSQISEIHFSNEVGFELVLRSGSRLVFGIHTPEQPLSRLNRLLGIGLDLDSPQRVDLDADTVAVATPIPSPS